MDRDRRRSFLDPLRHAGRSVHRARHRRRDRPGGAGPAGRAPAARCPRLSALAARHRPDRDRGAGPGHPAGVRNPLPARGALHPARHSAAPDHRRRGRRRHALRAGLAGRGAVLADTRRPRARPRDRLALSVPGVDRIPAGGHGRRARRHPSPAGAAADAGSRRSPDARRLRAPRRDRSGARRPRRGPSGVRSGRLARTRAGCSR